MDPSDSLIGSDNEALDDEVSGSENQELDQIDFDNGEEIQEREEDDVQEEEDNDHAELPKSKKRNNLKDNLTKKEAEEYRAREARKGVVYLSRIPPYMKVNTVRKYFEQYKIGRIYLAPEPEVVRKQRQRAGGNKRRCYSEGWIEFEDKNQAKLIALAFNNQKIGGKKRSFYYDDIWNIRYLPKFKWDNLTEKIVYDKKVRDAKLKAELSLAKKQQEFYLDQVEKGKYIERIIRNKEKRRAENNLDEDEEIVDAIEEQQEKKPQKRFDNAGVEDKDNEDRIRRVFKQKKPKKI